MRMPSVEIVKTQLSWFVHLKNDVKLKLNIYLNIYLCYSHWNVVAKELDKSGNLDSFICFLFSWV